MVWVRIDDRYNEHLKFASAGPLGVTLWLAGMAYCNRNLTDGFIPWTVARTLVAWEYIGAAGPTAILVALLDSDDEPAMVTSDLVIDQVVHSGLWDTVTGGYMVHDYLDYQPSRQAVMTERAAKAAAGRAGGLASAQARGVAPAQAPAEADTQAKSNPRTRIPSPVSDIPESPGSRSVRARSADEIRKLQGLPDPLPEDKQRALLEDVKAQLAPTIAPLPKDGTSLRHHSAPRETDEDIIARCQAILEDDESAPYLRDAARTQLQLMGVR